jgi:hypothetical protein
MEIVVIIRVEREAQQEPRLPRVSWSERRFAEALDSLFSISADADLTRSALPEPRRPSTSLGAGPSTSLRAGR